MVFNTVVFQIWDGMAPGEVNPTGKYCINDTSSPNYGTCYTDSGARFVQSDTTTYPIGSLPCEKNNSCIRYTSTAWSRTIYTIFNYGSKQAILTSFSLRTHGSITGFVSNISYLMSVYLASPIQDYAYSVYFPNVQYEISQWPVYIPTINVKAYFNPYTINYGNVAVIEWAGNMLTPILYVGLYENNVNNIWYMASGLVVWSYESSPLAIIPLDYNNDYAPYRELRNAFGYAANGVDQPGWNADDMIRVLKDIFPDRAWAVYDDVQKIMYLYNLTIDYVPDWLIGKLAPVGIKVLQPPSNLSTAQAWLNELNARNRQAGGP